MNLLHFGRFLVPLFILVFSVTLSEAQSFERPPVHKLVKGVQNKPPGRRKQIKIREPGKVTAAIRKQKADEKKRDKAYKEQLIEDRKHHLEIQSPEVRERMIQNRKDAETNYKIKKKAIASKNKNSAKKYR